MCYFFRFKEPSIVMIKTLSTCYTQFNILDFIAIPIIK